MKVIATSLPGLKVVETTPFHDSRGAFGRWYCERELAEIIGNRQIVQINHSRTVAMGAVRGLHFQKPPHAEMKLVRCIKGRVWDVAVDLRQGSPTCLKWHAEELTPANARMMAIPEGFAHGFQVLEPESELLYLHTAFYAPEFEDGVCFDDPVLSIGWPVAVSDVSARDLQHPLIDRDFIGLSV